MSSRSSSCRWTGVELVGDGGHAGGEVLDAAAEPVAAGQFGALTCKAGALVL